jgi:hypothetical protein
MFKLVLAFDANKLEEDIAFLKRTREPKSEVYFDNNPEKFSSMCDESYLKDYKCNGFLKRTPNAECFNSMYDDEE